MPSLVEIAKLQRDAEQGDADRQLRTPTGCQHQAELVIGTPLNPEHVKYSRGQLQRWVRHSPSVAVSDLEH